MEDILLILRSTHSFLEWEKIHAAKDDNYIIELGYNYSSYMDPITGREIVMTESIYNITNNIKNGFNPLTLDEKAELFFALV